MVILPSDTPPKAETYNVFGGGELHIIVAWQL